MNLGLALGAWMAGAGAPAKTLHPAAVPPGGQGTGAGQSLPVHYRGTEAIRVW